MSSNTSSSPTQPLVAIVTGAAQGIGYGIALRLAQDGLHVALNDVPSKLDKLNEVAEELRTKYPGVKVVVVEGDVSEEEAVKRIVGRTVEELGGVDCMVANAGIVPYFPFLDTSMETMDRCYAINARGTLLLFQYAAKQMIKQGQGGRLLAATSTSGKEAMSGLAAYAASKFAIRGIVQTAALEFAKHKITANAYAPGLIHSPQLDASIPTRPGEEPMSEEERMAAIRAAYGLPSHVYAAGPEVIGSLVSYLCKPEAYYITGQTISADSGWRPS